MEEDEVIQRLFIADAVAAAVSAADGGAYF